MSKIKLEKLKQKVKDIQDSVADKKVLMSFDFSEVSKRLAEFVDVTATDLEERYDQLDKKFDEISKGLGKIKDDDVLEMLKNLRDELETRVEETKGLIIKSWDDFKFPDEIKINQPEWFKQFSDTKLLNKLETLEKNMVEAIQDLHIKDYDMSIHQDPERALAVKLVGLDGRFYQIKSRGSTGGSSSSSGSSATEYAEDSAHSSGDSGVMALVVRKDSAATIAGNDGDYTALQVDSSGALRVTGGGGGTEYVVNDAAPTNPTGTTVLMERDDQLAALSEVEGDWTNARATSKGALWVAIADSSGDPITSFGGGTQYDVDDALGDTPTGTLSLAIRDDALSALTPAEGDAIGLRVNANGALWVIHSGTLAVTQSGTWDEVGINDSGNSITIDNAQLSVVGSGTEATALRVTIATDSTGVLSVDDNGGALTVDNGGTFAVQVDGAALTALQLIDDTVFADDAAFTAATSKVLAVGGIVTADSVDSGDIGAFAMLANRQQKVTLYDSGGIELAVGGGTQYATNAAYADTNVGNLAITIRDDALATLTEADGDFSALRVDSTGRLWTNVSNTVTVAAHAVTNAGTFAVQVDGAALTALQLIDDIVFAEDAVHSTGDKGVMALAVRQDSQADFGADGDYVPLSIDADGGLRVSIIAGAGSGGTAANDDADFTDGTTAGTPAMGVYESTPTTVTDGDLGIVGITEDRRLKVLADLSATDNAVLDAIAASVAAIDTDATTIIGHLDGVETLLGTIDTDTSGIITAVQLIDDAIIADDAAFTPATTKVMMAGFEADEGSTDSVDEGDSGAARMTLDRKLITTPQPHTSGGLAIHRSIDLDEGTLEVVKNSPGQVYGMWVTNTATTTRFIKFYDATSGTYGTGTPAMTIPVPGNTSDDITGVFNIGGMGIPFATGICVGAGTGIADADTGAPGANEVIVNIFYK